MKTITTERAVQIASWFHSGQWSAFYSFASTKKVSKNYHADYHKEVDHELSSKPWSVKDRKLLQSLKNYFNKYAPIPESN